jgi:hypothetical protein
MDASTLADFAGHYEDGNSCNVCLQSPAADVLIKGELRTLCREHMREALEDI